MNTKIKALLAAAGITSTVLLAVLALNWPVGFNGSQADNTETAEVDEEYVNALEERLAQLDEAKVGMEEREASYQTQIETAEQTIVELESTIEEVQAKIASNEEQLVQMEAEYANASGYSWSLQEQRDVLAAQEAEYTAQIESANQTILTLQAQISQMTGQ